VARHHARLRIGNGRWREARLSFSSQPRAGCSVTPGADRALRCGDRLAGRRDGRHPDHCDSHRRRGRAFRPAPGPQGRAGPGHSGSGCAGTRPPRDHAASSRVRGDQGRVEDAGKRAAAGRARFQSPRSRELRGSGARRGRRGAVHALRLAGDQARVGVPGHPRHLGRVRATLRRARSPAGRGGRPLRGVARGGVSSAPRGVHGACGDGSGRSDRAGRGAARHTARPSLAWPPPVSSTARRSPRERASRSSSELQLCIVRRTAASTRSIDGR